MKNEHRHGLSDESTVYTKKNNYKEKVDTGMDFVLRYVLRNNMDNELFRILKNVIHCRSHD